MVRALATTSWQQFILVDQHNRKQTQEVWAQFTLQLPPLCKAGPALSVFSACSNNRERPLMCVSLARIASTKKKGTLHCALALQSAQAEQVWQLHLKESSLSSGSMVAYVLARSSTLFWCMCSIAPVYHSERCETSLKRL